MSVADDLRVAVLGVVSDQGERGVTWAAAHYAGMAECLERMAIDGMLCPHGERAESTTWHLTPEGRLYLEAAARSGRYA